MLRLPDVFTAPNVKPVRLAIVALFAKPPLTPVMLTGPVKLLFRLEKFTSPMAFAIVPPVLTVKLLAAVWVIAPVVASAFNALAVIAPSSTRLLPAFAVNKPLAVVSFMVKLFASRMLIFEPVADTGD